MAGCKAHADSGNVRFNHDGNRLPECRVVRRIKAVGKLRGTESGLSGKTPDPVPVQESIELFWPRAVLDMRQVCVPHTIMGRLFEFQKRKDHFAAGLERTEGVAGVQVRFCGKKVGENRPVEHDIQG